MRLPDETLRLESKTDGVQPAEVAGLIDAREPRFAFYSHPQGGKRVLFLYTCPAASRIKERMVYSTSESWTRTVAERDAGIVVAKSLEATDPSELTAEVLDVGGEAAGDVPAETKAGAGGFARPKRPGRR